jgi:hypothetical protein
MNILHLTGIIAAGSLVAGLVGALTGLGGGVVIVPLLTVGLGVDIRYAVGASLVSVIATSSGAAAAYVREGFTNIRVAMLLEIATSTGALLGAALATHLPTGIIAMTFGAVLLHSAYASLQPPHPANAAGMSDPWSQRLRLDGVYPSAAGPQPYQVRRLPLGAALMGIAGMLSGLLGIGSGAIKVLAMDRAMQLPFKVSTTTSNFMIGVTAAAGAGVYLRRGYIDPGLAMPVMLGVLAGSLLGARLLSATPSRWLRLVFAVVIAILGIEMLFNGLAGNL